MKLQTKVDIPKMSFELGYRSRGLFIGSCFAENLQSYLKTRLADVRICPYGQLYNPLSILTYFSNCFTKKRFSSADMVKGPDGLWYSWDCHGSVYAEDEDSLVSFMDAITDEIKDIDYVVITLGTSWVYCLRDGRVVSNCHKMPPSMFNRRCLNVEEIVSALSGVVDLFPEKVRFILTVSPIRHVKDGLTENSLSKAKLRVAADILEKTRKNVHYFPSYEIMMDELRDYRFYADDMLHPSNLATSYIMETFVEGMFDSESKELFSQVSAIRQAYEHRPLHGLTPAFSQFRKKLYEKVEALSRRYPDADFSEFVFEDFE